MIEKIVNKINTTNPSFIFAGSRGVGKKHIALEVAKSVLCKKIPPCNNCDECRRIDKEIHPNVVIIKPEGDAKDIKIENIRELVKSLTFSAAEGYKRFVIIDEAHRMNESSFNALLKTLEEPPKDTIFILLTANLHSMLPTIISRCEVIKFPPISNEKMVQILNVSPSHMLIPYSMGSISTFNFYVANEPQISSLISFLQKPSSSYVDISDLAGDIMEVVSSDSKAQELEYMEYIISLILFDLTNKYKTASENDQNSSNILNCIEEIKSISKKIYLNTSPSIVFENMLLEVAKLGS
ncbi:MAG: DNA polymerase III subunit delta' [Proteobacteria bacterium]|nr:DNA polymerase III subunit delta' [Pseudomonadota bacterium]